MTLPDTVSHDSQAWQAASKPEELGAYLDRASTMPIVLAMAARTMNLMELQPGERVLDVGCGTGIFLPRLAVAVGLSGQVVGVDRAEPFVHKARERMRSVPNVRVDEGDAYHLPYEAGTFDVAHCERVLLHLEDPTAALREMRRVVRPGGRIVAVEPEWASVDIDHADHQTMDLLIREANTPRLHTRTGLELNRHMAGAGLTSRVIEAMAHCSRDYSEFLEIGVHLSEAADRLAADGRLKRDRAQQIFDDLLSASQSGTYFGFLAVFFGRASVPQGSQWAV